ncbi:MAG TPA: hypothetical protein VHE61_14620 [Opitutaceae bacterium]|nr:hypothetical protein [Opitutaceae bacterium]
MHKPILKRCGIVLIVVGALDIAYMVWCVANDRSYSSSLNIFAVVAGILLVRGSLKTARWVAMGASFLFAAGALAIVALPFMYPIGYWFAVLRHSSGVAATIVIALALLLVLFWIRQQLLRPEVLKAEQDAGVRPPRIRLAATIGAVLPVILVTVLGFMFHGDTAKEAIRRAHQQLSGNYQYVVTSMQMNSTPTEKNVAAVVVAYDDTEVRSILVKWKE